MESTEIVVPVVGYCLLFILLTAMGVSALRAELGLMQSISSRYRIYSDLLLIFAWFALVKTSRMAEILSLRRSRLFLGTTTRSLVFCIVMDGIGARYLRRRIRNWNMGWHSSSGREDCNRPSTPRIVRCGVMSDSTNMLDRFCSSQKKLERINRRHIEKVWATLQQMRRRYGAGIRCQIDNSPKLSTC
jgi:hypothetical protein